jgi:protein-tyrosine phosphatase
MFVGEVVPGLLIGNRLDAATEYSTLLLDVIVDLEDWEFAWVPPVPTGCIYVSFPIEDDDAVDPKVRQVAAFVASLVRAGHRVLVHCTEGLNRSGVVVGRALMNLGWPVGDAIAHVRDRRGPTEDDFLALSNPTFVEWLLAEAHEAPTEGDSDPIPHAP